MTEMTRRSLLRTLSAVPVAGMTTALPAMAQTAEFSLKYGNNLPVTHPLNIRAKEACDRILKESKGRVDIKIFPNNQLGGDTDMLSQVRSGGIDFFTPSALVIATLVPVAAINAVGFAFSDYNQVWSAMDGDLGAYVRAAIAKMRLHTFEKMWDNGFRQTTSSKAPITTAKDLDGLKIRVPVSPPSISMFKGLGAQENPLPIIQVAKLYEVQKFCSLTNHIWDGYWFIANGRTWERLPADLKAIVSAAINDAGMGQRDDIKKLNESVVGDLQSKGLAINRPAAETFRAKLREAGFYGEWKGRFGDEAWGLLEKSVGKLA